MQIVGIIPARYQSSRYPGKPLADIYGQPMIRRVYENARQARCLNRLLVATDDLRIAETVESFGGECVLTSGDHPSGTDRVAEVCRHLKLDGDDIAINIQGDEPLIEPVMIHLLVDAMDGSPDCPMATLAFASADASDYRNPNVVKLVIDGRQRALYFSRSPIPCRRNPTDGPLLFLKHLGFYAYRSSFLQIFTRLPEGTLERMEKLEQLRALEHGFPIKVALSPSDTLGVDTPEDLEQLLLLWEELQSRKRR